MSGIQWLTLNKKKHYEKKKKVKNLNSHCMLRLTKYLTLVS